MTDQQKIMIIIVMMSISAFVALQFIFVGPSKTRLSHFQTKVSELSSELKQKQGVARKYPQLVSEKENVEKKLKSWEGNLITPTEFDFFRNTLRDLGAEYDVRVIRDQLETIPDNNKSVFKQQPLYTEKNINLTLVCRYHDFGGFLNRVEDSSPFRKVTRFSMSPAGSKEKEHRLQIQVSILSLLLEQG